MTRFKGFHGTTFRTRKRGSKADQALRLARKVAKQQRQNTEYNAVDKTQVGGSGDVITTTGGIYHLTPIVQGDTSASRDGNECQLYSVKINWNVIIDPADATNFFRLMLFRWRDNVAPTVSDINPYQSNIAAPIAQWNFPNREKFQVLRDIMMPMSDAGSKAHIGTIYRKLKMKAKYNAATGTSIEDNNLYLAAFSDSSISGPSLMFQSRVRFVA